MSARAASEVLRRSHVRRKESRYRREEDRYLRRSKLGAGWDFFESPF